MQYLHPEEAREVDRRQISRWLTQTHTYEVQERGTIDYVILKVYPHIRFNAKLFE